MGIKNLRMLVDVIQLVTARGGVTVREMCESLGIARSSGHRLVASLAEMRFIQKDRDGARYVLGPLVGELAGGPFAWRALVSHCRPEMEALRSASGETVALHVMQAERRVLLDQAESTQQLRWVYSNPQVPMPLHAGAAAKMLLALLPVDDVMRIVRRDELVTYTHRTPKDLAGLLRELEQIRARGYSESLEEVTPGIASIAVPVIAEPFAGQPRAVMSLTGPVVRLPAARLQALLAPLKQAAQRALWQLGQALGETRQAA